MDEYELIEVELSDLFRIYLEKHRNLDYLQSQLDRHTLREKERMDENERKMREIQRKINNAKDDELSMMRGEREIVEGGLDDEFNLDEDEDSLQVCRFAPSPFSCSCRTPLCFVSFPFRAPRRYRKRFLRPAARSCAGKAARGCMQTTARKIVRRE